MTGAASGIGAATVELLTERGFEVIGVDLRNADVQADFSTPDCRSNAVQLAVEIAGGTVDASAPVPLNYHQGPESVAQLMVCLGAKKVPTRWADDLY